MLRKILSDLSGLKTKGGINTGIELVIQLSNAESDIDIGKPIDMLNDGFIEKLTAEKNFSNENLEKLADIFFIVAENTPDKAENRDAKKKLAEKCITIWEYLEKNEIIYSFDRHLKTEKIKAYLQ